MDIDPYNLRFQDVCAYIEYVTSFGASANTVKNKLSHVRVHYTLLDLDSDVLSVVRSIDAIERDPEYEPRTKDPLPPSVFRDILGFLPHDVNGIITRAALLVLYYGALRQSELLPISVSKWDAKKHPMRQDLTFSQDSCALYINHGKNMQKSGQHRIIQLASVHDERFCPVRALTAMVAQVPATHDQPLFVFPRTNKPVPSSYVNRQYHAALDHLQIPNAKRRFSLHSLRKAAATNAFTGGCSELSIKRYGAWSSSAYTTYIQTSNEYVNQSLISAIL